MTKHDLAKAITSASSGISIYHAEQAVDGLIRTLSSELAAGRDVQISGLGRFRIAEQPARPERKGRNPRTGEAIDIPAQPAKRVVRFTPSTRLLG